ncbi:MULTISPECIES: GNAT family N-acetyltransferase [unclassified Endozoicomonas]|uniref:GNAT family N-acetyltransferase n=1 Tax=unclassified Endozoicomonas TaxID=2644528 RepID=UPI002147B68A|nr:MULTISPECIES: GNAT family N-acetyltransferase [unclassified Endozoicomonas]
MIREVESSDIKRIVEIYNHYVRNTAFTFEEEEILASDIDFRVNKIKSDGLPWIVLINDSKVVGYAYASQWHDRSAYRFSVETTIYLDPNFQSKGLGSALYRELLKKLQSKRIKTAIGCITLPNEKSVALHENLGMKKVAHFEKVGFKFNQWQDVGYWQMIMPT